MDSILAVRRPSSATACYEYAGTMGGVNWKVGDVEGGEGPGVWRGRGVPVLLHDAWELHQVEESQGQEQEPSGEDPEALLGGHGIPPCDEGALCGARAHAPHRPPVVRPDSYVRCAYRPSKAVAGGIAGSNRSGTGARNMAARRPVRRRQFPASAGATSPRKQRVCQRSPGGGSGGISQGARRGNPRSSLRRRWGDRSTIWRSRRPSGPDGVAESAAGSDMPAGRPCGQPLDNQWLRLHRRSAACPLTALSPVSDTWTPLQTWGQRHPMVDGV